MGNEPGWTLDLGGGRLVLVADYGATKVDVPLPVPVPLEAARRYVTKTSDGRALEVTLIDVVCADTMTGMPRPVTVEVAFDGRTLKGCGGDATALLRGKTWVVEDISGRGVIDRARVTMVFGQSGRLSGAGPCNPFRASYVLTGEGLAITMPISGVRSCAAAQMAQETVFLEVMRGVQRFEMRRDGALVLHAADGGTITARAEDPVQAALDQEAKKKAKKK
jgi:heat shock protein HslJ